MAVTTRRFAIAMVVALGVGLMPMTAAQASVSNPKRGDCYMYTNVDIAPIAAVKPSVPCSATHNQETYRVGRWPSAKSPYAMSDKARLEVGVSVCTPFKGESEFFNYFNYYMPTKKQWAAGARWVRCDAAIKVNEGSPNQWESWKGLILDIR